MNGGPNQQQPQNPFAYYASMAQPTQDQRRQQMVQQFANQIMAQPAQTAAVGAGQLATGIGMGLMNYNQKQNEAFPQAPGGAKPSLMTGLANFFTGRNNGGLY